MRLVFPLLAFLFCCSCAASDMYVRADRLTYKAIAPEYSQYVKADEVLSPEQKARRLHTLETWKLRIDTAGGK